MGLMLLQYRSSGRCHEFSKVYLASLLKSLIVPSGFYKGNETRDELQAEGMSFTKTKKSRGSIPKPSAYRPIVTSAQSE